MKEALLCIINKISSYQIFNFIMPGACMLGVMKFLLGIDIKIDADIWWLMLACYVVGMTLSRVGSIVIEGVCRLVKQVKPYDVRKYQKARKQDDFVNLMLSLVNTYRTLAAVCLMLAVVALVRNLNLAGMVFASLSALFTVSYVKQYHYFENLINQTQNA